MYFKKNILIIILALPKKNDKFLCYHAARGDYFLNCLKYSLVYIYQEVSSDPFSNLNPSLLVLHLIVWFQTFSELGLSLAIPTVIGVTAGRVGSLGLTVIPSHPASETGSRGYPSSGNNLP